MSCEVAGADSVSCEPGVFDCCSVDTSTAARFLLQCAPYASALQPPDELKWLAGLAMATMALMSFGIGANDAANSWGTSVGSGAISLRWAVVLGGLMDWLGASALGAGVSDTIRKDVTDTQAPECWACGYCDSKMSLFMLGMTAALLATAIFLILSSTTAMPVSTTHAVVGAVVGMALVAVGPKCVRWRPLGKIVASWLLSPLLSGVLGAALYQLLQRYIVMSPGPEQRALRASPWLLAGSTSSIAALVLLKSPLCRGLPWYGTLLISVTVFVLTMAVAHFFVVPSIWQRIVSSKVTSRVAEVEMAEHTEHADAGTSALEHSAARSALPTIDEGDPHHDERSDSPTASPGEPQAEHTEEPPAARGPKHASGGQAVGEGALSGAPREGRAAAAHHASQLYPVPLNDDDDDDDIWSAVLPRGPPAATPTAQPGMYGSEQYNEAQLHGLFVFKYLLVFVAALESFAHGANDTGNATGAFSAVWLAYKNGLTSCNLDDTPLWVMPAGGLFVCLGVYMLGHRVIRTMGFGLASINFLRGFCIEFASTAAVVIATVIGMPVSTTHCQVGAVVFVGWTAFGRQHVQWGMLGRIAVTWIVTLPLAGGLAAAILASSEALIRR